MSIKDKISAIKERNKKKKEDRARELIAAEEFIKNVFPTEEKVVNRWSDILEEKTDFERAELLLQLNMENPYLCDLVKNEIQRRLAIVQVED